LGVLFCPKIKPKRIPAISTEIPHIILRRFKTDSHLSFTRVGGFHMQDSDTKFIHQIYHNIRQERTKSTLSNAQLNNTIRKYIQDFIHYFEFEQRYVKGHSVQICQIEMVFRTNFIAKKATFLKTAKNIVSTEPYTANRNL